MASTAYATVDPGKVTSTLTSVLEHTSKEQKNALIGFAFLSLHADTYWRYAAIVALELV